MAKLEDFHFRRNKGNALISQASNLILNRFLTNDTDAYREGAIPVKYKEMLGLVASMVLQCKDCITYHIEQCHKLGVTKEELIEAMNIALLVGGSIIIPNLRYALEIIEELNK